MTDEHEQLTHAPLVEALFEARFEPPMAYGLLPGQLFDRLRSDFSEPQELSAANLPVDLPSEMMPTVVRHRFTTPDGGRLFQLGNGILTVNHTGYQRFGPLNDDIRKVWGAFVGVTGDLSLKRLGLRYINRIDLLQHDWNDIVTAKYELPASAASKVSARRLSYLLLYEADRLNLTLADATVDGRPMLHLDLDYYLPDASEIKSDIDSCLAWVKQAHDVIYQIFKDLLTPEYFEEIR
jgi:uncharacterized protein (TIGR04255 family)